MGTPRCKGSRDDEDLEGVIGRESPKEKKNKASWTKRFSAIGERKKKRGIKKLRRMGRNKRV